jgi:hypothetical protein
MSQPRSSLILESRALGRTLAEEDESKKKVALDRT